MSLIEPENINYLSTVEQFFVSLKDSGISLSAKDYYLIEQWESQGVPVEVLCRAIELGVAQASERRRGPWERLSLSYLKDRIDEEINRMPR